ncbi:monoglyceride lipase [Corchorus olitorius]|uniref:Monoglyceride lipase n=1 Tax=Corchorus olitorius TaxID=93759 RepID=A0A1R3G008_9ROSI|nr:monoglyceride lipase [Corchorus olitorius]
MSPPRAALPELSRSFDKSQNLQIGSSCCRELRPQPRIPQRSLNLTETPHNRTPRRRLPFSDLGQSTVG